MVLVTRCKPVACDRGELVDMVGLLGVCCACRLRLVAPALDFSRKEAGGDHFAGGILGLRDEVVAERYPFGVLGPTQRPTLRGSQAHDARIVSLLTFWRPWRIKDIRRNSLAWSTSP